MTLNIRASKSDAESEEDFDKKLDRESQRINDFKANGEKLSKCCRLCHPDSYVEWPIDMDIQTIDEVMSDHMFRLWLLIDTNIDNFESD